jgi:hypothetical protein
MIPTLSATVAVCTEPDNKLEDAASACITKLTVQILSFQESLRLLVFRNVLTEQSTRKWNFP